MLSLEVGHDLPGAVAISPDHDVRLSDHSPFWDAGTNALMATDTSFMRNSHFHQMSDAVEALDLGFFAAALEGLEDFLGA